MRAGQRNWSMIGIGLFLVVFVSVVFTNAWFEYDQLRIDQSVYYDPDAAREILIIGIPLVAIGMMMIWVGSVGRIALPVGPRHED